MESYDATDFGKMVEIYLLSIGCNTGKRGVMVGNTRQREAKCGATVGSRGL